jgi:GTPase SAR1 family protein
MIDRSFMAASPSKLDALLRRIGAAVTALPAGASADAVARFRADALAASFHITRTPKSTPLVAILGGTGTGKSTLVNRLLTETVTAASFRRTLTAGCVAVARSFDDVPKNWLGAERVTSVETPTRGTPDTLTVVAPASTDVVLVDTPDLDGDHPAHHAQADRAFRWATAIVFVVTPEKYQMTELLPYYRLAKRYALPTAFVLNKSEERAVVEDYRELLASRDWPDAPLFVVPRDDAAFDPGEGESLGDLRTWLDGRTRNGAGAEDVNARLRDLSGRLRDQVIAPARHDRKAADDTIAQLRALETPPAGVDVNPLTQQLQRRMQQRSVLYLIGPQRVLDRARQIPSLLARLPRAAWDYVVTGELPKADAASLNGADREVPDFHQLLVDAFAVVRTRVDDVVRSSPELAKLACDPTYTGVFLPSDRAAAIADEELASLKSWLDQRWNANPRDTKVVQKLLKLLPGGEKLSQWSEAAPYLLAVVVATHHAFFGHVDLLILGGYSLATWLTERVSNEVTARTRAANRAIAERFTKLAHEQVSSVCGWLDARTPNVKAIEAIERATEELEEAVEPLPSGPSTSGRG